MGLDHVRCWYLPRAGTYSYETGWTAGARMITTTETVVVDGDLDVSLQEHLRRIGASDGIAVDIETSGLSLLDARVHVISVAVPGLTVVIPLKEHQAPLL